MNMFLNSSVPVYITRPTTKNVMSVDEVSKVLTNHIRNIALKQLKESKYDLAYKTNKHHIPEFINHGFSK